MYISSKLELAKASTWPTPTRNQLKWRNKDQRKTYISSKLSGGYYNPQEMLVKYSTDDTKLKIVAES